MERKTNPKCFHATSLLVKDYPSKHIAEMVCTWNCCQPYWVKTNGLISKEISKEEAQHILESA